MKKSSWVILYSSFFLLAFGGCVSNTKYSLNSFDQKAKKYVNKRSNKALAVGYLKNGQIHTKAYGIQSEAKPTLPDENTVFELGAITQVFTSSLMMSLVEEGLFDPADCINEYLPTAHSLPNYLPYKCVDVVISPNVPSEYEWLYLKVATSCSPDYDASKCVSFCHLASHSSGLRVGPKNSYKWNPFGRSTHPVSFRSLLPNQLYLTIHQKEIAATPGKQFYYSSTGMALLGNTLANIKKQPFEALISEKILEPLRMSQTFFQAPPTIVQGHNAKGNPVAPTVYHAYAPAAGIKSTVADLLLFLEAQLDDKQAFNQRFWSSHEFKVKSAQSKEKRPVGAAYGWMISPLKQDKTVDVFWCNGGTNGYRAFIAFEKRNKTAVVLLSNSAESVDQIGFYLLEAIQKQERSDESTVNR